MHCFGTSDTGKKRTENQDAFLCDADLGVFAVSDGMGGLRYGKETSREVIRLLQMFVSFENFQTLNESESCSLLETMILEINQEIIDMGNTDDRYPLYGSTLTGFLVQDGKAVVFNVGDSRVYLLRRGCELQQLTTDDSLLQSILKGNVEPSEEEKIRAAGILLQYMGMCETLKPKTQIVKLQEGDILCACSDGLSGMITDEQIASVLIEEISIEEKGKKLICKANEAGGKDNITVVLAEKGKEN